MPKLKTGERKTSITREQAKQAIDVFRCSVCGKFIAYNEAHQVKTNFTPDSALTEEVISLTHLKCL